MAVALLQGRKVMQMMVGTAKAQQQQQAEASSRADSIKSLPAPTDPAVRLAVAGGEIVAVMPFEGYITPEVAAAIRQKLADALKAGKHQGPGAEGARTACSCF
jgi:ABC-type sugar transport system ATPase subunit